MWTTIKLEKSNWFLFIVIAFYIFVAFNSSGYNNADEHYQIVEFANYKLGKATPSDLAWEFAAKIRPGLQPALCYFIFKGIALFGVTDVYYLAFILRLISAVLAIFVIRFFINSSGSIVEKKNYNGFVILSYFLWFLPYINVRFSSENWSGLFFLASLALLQCNNYQYSVKKLLLLGALLGTSMLFRYQSAFFALGIIFWLLIITKLNVKKIAIIIGALLVMLFVGFFIDRWLYGEYSFTLYNYFYVNIVEKVASNYGVSPWYEIVLYIIKAPGPLGIFIFLTFIILIIYNPKSVFIWSTIPFLIVHSIIPHKELRFLFPVANLAPLVLTLGYQHIDKIAELKYKSIAAIVFVVFFVTNTAGLIAISTKGAGLAKVSVTQYIHRNYLPRRINVLYVDGLNPYSDWTFPKNTFYNSSEVELTQIPSIWKDDVFIKKKTGYTNLLIISDNEITGPRTVALLEKLKLVKVYQSIPRIVQIIDGFYDPSMNDSGLMVYEFKDR